MKRNYSELYKATEELRHMNPEAIYLVGGWIRRYADKTSLQSLAELLMSWSASSPQTPEQVAELESALGKLAKGETKKCSQ